MAADFSSGNRGLTFAANARNAGKRREMFLDGFFELVEQGADVRGIYSCLREAMLNAVVSDRVADATLEKGWNYADRPDHAVRISAAKIMAEIIGLIPKAGAVNVNLQDNSVRVTVDQQLSEVLSIGGDTSAILAEMRSVIDRASGIESPKPENQETSKLLEI